jgi:hypothetical protein
MMWKHISEGIAGFGPQPFRVRRVADWPWRKILADGGLLAAFLLTSSWLMRG